MSAERYIAERLVRNRMKKSHKLFESSEKVPRSYYKKVEYILNHRLGSYETGVRVENIDIISETPGTITLKVDYQVGIQIPMVDPEDGRTYYETDSEYRSQTMTFDFDELDESDRIVPSRDPDYEEPVKLKCIIDTWNMIDKYGIEDWEDHDSYISVSKDSYEKMLNGSKNKRYIMNLRLKEDLTLDDDPEETDQQYSSAATSINSSKLPALFSMVDFKEGSINLDYGGGRFDNVAEYLKDKYGATNLVYDKYNRSAQHNKEVLEQVHKTGGADTVTLSNVLNVIAEASERLAVLRNCKRFLKSGGTCYITVYEGSGKGEGAPTKSGYQLNSKTKDYEDEIKKVFSSVTRKGKLYICE